MLFVSVFIWKFLCKFLNRAFIRVGRFLSHTLKRHFLDPLFHSGCIRPS